MLWRKDSFLIIFIFSILYIFVGGHLIDMELHENNVEIGVFVYTLSGLYFLTAIYFNIALVALKRRWFIENFKIKK
jgi:fumarate reductase subunit D